ncbi:PIN domain [Phaffia rhodozyma]|uniref:PIN domain n=1 Tax=Phaffia rhodozyma TaxID=264483 RepID=A0A0F7SLK4_PHARH|nr:PIN domain [Phaffia rhodozyma]
MAYAFTHPVTSPFSATHDVPVIISVDGKDEEFLELDLGMDIEWTVTEDAWSPSSLHKECEQRTALSHGWYQDDWGIKSHDHHQKPYIVLCLDTNVILSQLPLLRSVHHLVLTMYPAEPSPISFLIPFAVLRELDGLKSSTKLVQQSRIPGQPGTDRSTHAITVGYLAQRANRWLLDVKRAERTESIGIGLIRGDLELDRTIDPVSKGDPNLLT